MATASETQRLPTRPASRQTHRCSARTTLRPPPRSPNSQRDHGRTGMRRRRRVGGSCGWRPVHAAEVLAGDDRPLFERLLGQPVGPHAGLSAILEACGAPAPMGRVVAACPSGASGALPAIERRLAALAVRFREADELANLVPHARAPARIAPLIGAFLAQGQCRTARTVSRHACTPASSSACLARGFSVSSLNFSSARLVFGVCLAHHVVRTATPP